MNAGWNCPRELPQASCQKPKNSELEETIRAAHEALCKADRKNIRLCKPVVDSLSQYLHRETTSK